MVEDGALLSCREGDPATGVVSDQDAQRRSTGSRVAVVTAQHGEPFDGDERLLDAQRTDLVVLRGRV